MSPHVRTIAEEAAPTSNGILGSLIIRDAFTHIHLFGTFVLPKLLYASAAWRPHPNKAIKLLQTICNEFRMRLAYEFDIK